MKREAKDLWNIPIKDIPTFLNARIEKAAKFVENKINYYRKRPGLFRSNLNSFFYRAKYNLQNYIDPPPPQGKKERTDDYFDRIDPKYGLRFYKTMVNIALNIDLGYALEQVKTAYRDKKSRDLMKEFVIKVAEVEQKNKEQYQKFLIRSEILKNQG